MALRGVLVVPGRGSGLNAKFPIRIRNSLFGDDGALTGGIAGRAAIGAGCIGSVTDAHRSRCSGRPRLSRGRVDLVTCRCRPPAPTRPLGPPPVDFPCDPGRAGQGHPAADVVPGGADPNSGRRRPGRPPAGVAGPRCPAASPGGRGAIGVRRSGREKETLLHSVAISRPRAHRENRGPQESLSSRMRAISTACSVATVGPVAVKGSVPARTRRRPRAHCPRCATRAGSTSQTRPRPRQPGGGCRSRA